MRVLLTGGSGVLSKVVAAVSLQRGWDVAVINRGHGKAPEGAEVILSDCRDYANLTQKLQGRTFDVVVDFLCFNAQDVNESFTFYSPRCKHYFLISSAFVYDFSQQGVKAESSTRGLTCWAYSLGKVAAEDALVECARASSCPYTIIRPMVTYGDTRIPYGIAPRHGYDWTMIARARAGKPIITWHGGQDHCNLMHVDDFVENLLPLFTNPHAYGQCFNICSSRPSTWNDVLDAMAAAIGRQVPRVDIPVDFLASCWESRAAEIRGRSFDACVSNEKLRATIPEFHEKCTLPVGITRTLRAYEQQHYQFGIDWEYDSMCDYVIRRWARANRMEVKASFVDYLGTAKWRDRWLYWKNVNRDTALVSVFELLVRFCNKARRVLA